MKIARRGTLADFGESSIELTAPVFTWNKGDSSLSIRQSDVKDFSTESHHNYNLRLSLDEIQKLLLALSDAAILEPHKFEKGLEQSLRPLLRLQAVVSGVVG